MNRIHIASLASLAGALLVLPACGGGGGGSTSAVPAATATAAAQGTLGPMGAVAFSLTVPSAGSGASSARAPKFVSPSTASMVVSLQNAATPLATIDLSPTSPGCASVPGGTQCTTTAPAPVGNDTFVVTTYDGAGGSGHLLSTATLGATIAANQTNTVSLVLNGVVAAASVLLGSTSVLVGNATSVAVTVVGYDSAGNVIIGPGNYSAPVALTNSDTSGATTLSTNSVVAPGTNVTLRYTGGSLNGATITPHVGATAGTPATFTATGYAFANYAIPAGDSNNINVLAAGPGDGNVWYATYAAIGKMSPLGQATEYTNGLPTASIYALAPGTGGVTWFADDSGDIGSISTAGTVTPAVSYSAYPSCSSNGKNNGDAHARSTKQVETAACSGINAMIAGPDGNVWFADDDAMIGNVTPGGAVSEWDITALPGWPGGTSEPEQVAFGPDGNLYVADYAGFIARVTLSGGAPAAITTVTLASNCGTNTIAAGPDGNIWFGDSCANIGTIPPGNFTSGGMLMWSVYGVTGDGYLSNMVATPGSVWFTDDNSAVYRLSGLAGVSASTSPAITPVNPFSSPSADPYALAVGPDGNLWVASDRVPEAVAKIVYGAPGTGTQSTVRGLPAAVHRAVRATGRHAAANRHG